MRMNFDPSWRFRFFECLFVICLVSLGCGGNDGPVVAPVKGVVTFDGKPLAGAEVIYRVKDSPRVSVGLTDDKGEYRLTTFNTDDGAIVGDNLISIRQIPKDLPGVSGTSLADMQSGKAKVDAGSALQPWKNSDKVLGASTIPPKYGNPEKSGLKRTVVLGDKNEFNLDLKP